MVRNVLRFLRDQVENVFIVFGDFLAWVLSKDYSFLVDARLVYALFFLGLFGLVVLV